MVSEKATEMKLWRIPFEVLVHPLPSFNLLRHKSIQESLSYLLLVGLVTSILAGLLSSLWGIDYQNPSNCGGSAQIFAHWFVYQWIQSSNWLQSMALYIIANEVGYLLLALVSAPILAVVTSFATEKTRRTLLAPAMSAVCYGMTPGSILGWIPNPFFLIGILTLVYQIVAFWIIMEISKAKAIGLGLIWLLAVGILQDIAVFLFQMILYV